MKVKWNPEDYRGHSDAQRKFAEDLLARLGKMDGGAVLDLGCGDGRLTAFLAENFPDSEVVGADSSREMVEYARTNFPSERHPNLSFRELDFSDLDYDGRFGLVFSNAALHWLPGSHLGLLRKIRRALRPGGRALLQMGGKGNAGEILEIADSMITAPKWAGYFEGFGFKYGFHGAETYREWMEEAGFTDINCWILHRDMEQKGRDGLASWIRTTWMPYTQRVPEASREEYIFELADAYLARFPADSNGVVRMGMVRLQAEASAGK